MSAKRLLFGLLIIVLVLPALAIIPFAGAQEGPPQVGLRPDAPPYALHGPYWVGTRDLVIGEDTDRPLQVTIWYPCLNPEGLEETTAYPIAVKVVGFAADWRAPIAGHALVDAAPDMASAPYPLVVFSHGFGGNRQWYAYLTEHLASYGFVVIAPDHLEMFDSASSELGESAIERPMDIQQVIAFAETLTGSDGEMTGLYDIEQIAVAGHSYGGYTALTAAGALFDTAAFNARCTETSPDAEFMMFCNRIVPVETDLAALAGLDALPEGLWPSWGDPRVKAVVSLAGSPLIQAEGLKNVTIPLLAMVGTVDTAGEGLVATRQIFDSVSSAQKALVMFENAEHNIYGASGEDVPALVEMGFFPICSDSVWDMNRAHDLINHFTTAFLLTTLKGNGEAAAALAPDAVQFPGITYEAQGY